LNILVLVYSILLELGVHAAAESQVGRVALAEAQVRRRLSLAEPQVGLAAAESQVGRVALAEAQVGRVSLGLVDLLVRVLVDLGLVRVDTGSFESGGGGLFVLVVHGLHAVKAVCVERLEEFAES
jgi:hypothetical protein